MTPGKQQYAAAVQRGAEQKPANAHDVTKRSAEVEFYIRATKPARAKLGRCQSVAR